MNSRIRFAILCIWLALGMPGCVNGGVDFAELGQYWKETVLKNGALVRYNPKAGKFVKTAYNKPNGKMTNPSKEGWSIIRTNLGEIEDAFNFDILDHIVRLSEQNPEKDIVVIDWGCGMGTAIDQLARQADRYGVTNVKFIGFGNLYFPSWQYLEGNVEFIFDDLRQLRKYLEPNSVGLIYSHFGLYHVQTPALVKHMKELEPYLMDGAVVIGNTCEIRSNTLLELVYDYHITEYMADFDKIEMLKKDGINPSKGVMQLTHQKLSRKDKAQLGAVEGHLMMLKEYVDTHDRKLEDLVKNVKRAIFRIERKDLRRRFLPYISDLEFVEENYFLYPQKSKELVSGIYLELHKALHNVGCGMYIGVIPL